MSIWAGPRELRAASTTWNLTGGGNWGTAGNWTAGGFATGVGATASLLSKISANSTIEIKGDDIVLGSLVFDNAKNYQITSKANGTLTFDNTGSTDALITINSTSAGAHEIATGFTINDGLTVNNLSTTAFTISGNIAQAASNGLTKSGTGTLVLSGTNGYTGITAINKGTLQISGGSAISNSSAITIANDATAILDLNASSETIASLTMSGGKVTTGGGTLTSTGAVTLAGTFDGGSGGTKGTLSLAGDLTTSSATLTNAPNITLTGTTQTFNGSSLTGVGTITKASGTLNIQSNLSGATASLGTTTVNLFNASNTNETLTLSGATTIGAGKIDGGIGATKGTLSVGGDLSTTSTTFANAANLTFAGATQTFSGSSITGVGALIKASGTLNVQAGLSAVTASLGTSTVNLFNATNVGQTLATSGGSTIGAGTIDGGSGATKGTLSVGGDLSATSTTFTRTPNLTVNNALAAQITGNAITGIGTFTKSSGGTLSLNQNLSAASALLTQGTTDLTTKTLTSTATVSVSNGATLSTGTSGSTGAVDILGTLSGTGTVGTAQIESGGFVAPSGASATGTLNTGALTFLSGSTYQAEANGAAFDKLSVTGTAALAGTLSLSAVGSGFTAAKYNLIHSSGTRTGTFTATGVPSAYALVYGANDVDLQHRADQANATATAVDAFAGSAVTVSGSVTNTAISGSSNLTLGLADNGGTLATSGYSPNSGTVATGTPTSFTASIANVGVAGMAKAWSIKNTDASAVTTTALTSGIVNVYDHTSGALSVNALSLPTVIVGYGAGVQTSSGVIVQNSGSTYAVNLKATGGTSNGVTLGNVSGIVHGSGSASQFATLATGRSAGAVDATVTYQFGDDSTITGHSDTRGSATVHVTGAVLAHSNSTFGAATGTDVNSATYDLGTFNRGSGIQQVSLANIIRNLADASGYTAALDFDSIGAVSGNTGVISIDNSSLFAGLAADSTSAKSLLTAIDTGSVNGLTQAYSATYTLKFSDPDLYQSLGGTTANNGGALTITLTGTVNAVPEPASLGIFGITSAGLLARRRRQA